MKNNNIWFTSDTHFGHFNCIKYNNRPFKSIEEMDSILIDNWNTLINKNNIIYHLGDFCFGDASNYLKKLNGKIHLIEGSHDRRTIRDYSNMFVSIKQINEIKIQNIGIIMCHYCMRVWPKSHYGSFHLYGHSHGRLNPIGKSYDVGVDSNNFKPVNIEQIFEIMKTKEDNPNMIYKNI